MSSHSGPNVLWLVLEDVSPEFGCYDGPDAVETPNIDRLAAEGVRYTDVHCTNPTCSPSRSALATGMYQTAIGAHHQRCHQDPDAPEPPNPLPDGVRVVSDWLRGAGYLAVNATEFPDSVGIEVNGKLDWNFTYRGEPFDTNDWTDIEQDQPFFAQVSFREVHRPWVEDVDGIPDPATPDDAEIPPYLPDHPTVREDFAGYYNTIIEGDRKVGAVVDDLEARGLLEDTVVVLTADHGRAMLRDKQQPYDGGLHVPMVVRWPENHPEPAGYERGTVDTRLLSSIDLTATTLSVVGVEPPESMHGRVFLGIDADDPRTYVFSAVDRIAEVPGRRRTVRSKRYRYVRNYHPGRPWLRENRHVVANRDNLWVLRKLEAEDELDPVQAQYLSSSKPPEELYDCRDDPHQVENVVDSMADREVLDRLRNVLDDWVTRTDDQGRFPEYPEATHYYETTKAQNYDEAVEKRREEWGL
jgi:arylsulfatase A-like enzyme